MLNLQDRQLHLRDAQGLLLETAVAAPHPAGEDRAHPFFLFAPILLCSSMSGSSASSCCSPARRSSSLAAIRMLETSEQRTHPLRLELDNFFFVQAIAGPERSRIVGIFLHGMSWLTLVVMPVVLLLYVQLVFLPYHDVAITWAHRVVLLADIALLVFIGVFLWRRRHRSSGRSGAPACIIPLGLMSHRRLLAVVACFSLVVATIPGEAIDGWHADLMPRLPARRQCSLAGYAVPCLDIAPDGIAVRPLPPQPHRHRHGPGASTRT